MTCGTHVAKLVPGGEDPWVVQHSQEESYVFALHTFAVDAHDDVQHVMMWM
jgi:hypothetical protein